MPLLSILSCRIQHIFNKNSIPGIRGIDEHMGHGADDLIVLNDGTSARE